LNIWAISLALLSFKIISYYGFSNLVKKVNHWHVQHETIYSAWFINNKHDKSMNPWAVYKPNISSTYLVADLSDEVLDSVRVRLRGEVVETLVVGLVPACLSSLSDIFLACLRLLFSSLISFCCFSSSASIYM